MYIAFDAEANVTTTTTAAAAVGTTGAAGVAAATAIHILPCYKFLLDQYFRLL